MTRIIKRYSNRKCYDTETSRYINIEDIEELVRDEVDIKIIDNSTKEDITAIYLSKIIMTQEKRNKDRFTPMFLTREIQRRSKPMLEKFMGTYKKGSDILFKEYEQAKELIGKLLAEGVSEKDAKELVNNIIAMTKSSPKEVERFIDSRIKSTMSKLGAPSEEEIDELNRKLDELQKKLNELK